MFKPRYSEISVNRLPAFDYLLREDEVINATLTFQDDTTAVYEGIKAARGNPQLDSCYTDISGDSCITGVPFGPIGISKQNIDSLYQYIDAVPQKSCRTDHKLACDYAVLCVITIDGISADYYCCGEINDGYFETFFNLIDYLDYLAGEK